MSEFIPIYETVKEKAENVVSDIVEEVKESTTEGMELLGPALKKAEDAVKEEFEVFESTIDIDIPTAIKEILDATIKDLDDKFTEIINMFKSVFEKFTFFEKNNGNYKFINKKLQLASDIANKSSPENFELVKGLSELTTQRSYFKMIYECLSIPEIFSFITELSGTILTISFFNSLLEIFGLSIIGFIGLVSLPVAAIISNVGSYLVIIATVIFFISILITVALFVKSKFPNYGLRNIVGDENKDLISDDMNKKFDNIINSIDSKLNNISYI